MKSKKLLSLGRRKRFKSELDWIDSRRAELEQLLDTSGGELLTEPFEQWVKSLKIKTPNGLARFELFDWQKETAQLITGETRANGRQIVVLSAAKRAKPHYS